MSIIAAFIAALLLAGTASAATPKRWYWTESHAEAVVMAKVRIPYCRVYPNDSSCPGGPGIGFALQSATCTGASERAMTFTYAKFVCKIVIYNGYATGRIAVYPTGRATLHWKII